MHAIRIIQHEHRALAAVMHAMLHVVREIRYFNVKPNFELLHAMAYYIQAFPEQLHHPKEEAYLFKFLRVRRPEAGPLLDRLEAQHQAGSAKLKRLEQALARYEQEGVVQFAAFAEATAAYAAFHWDHASLEEREILPLARAHLKAEDWSAVDAAFTANNDPLVDAANAEFDELFRKIVSLAPPPLGIGPKLQPMTP